MLTATPAAAPAAPAASPASAARLTPCTGGLAADPPGEDHQRDRHDGLTDGVTQRAPRALADIQYQALELQKLSGSSCYVADCQ